MIVNGKQAMPTVSFSFHHCLRKNGSHTYIHTPLDVDFRVIVGGGGRLGPPRIA